MLMALTVPLTFSMDSTNAVLLLMGMHVGSVSGGLISATLLKMPGTPSAMTTFDGYPMANKESPAKLWPRSRSLTFRRRDFRNLSDRPSASAFQFRP